MKKLFIAMLMAISIAGCSRVNTGEVGLRVNFDKTVEASERPAGSINQVLIGEMIHFPVREIAAEVKDMTPQAADNSTMQDFDLTVVYNINPTTVSDLYINKSRSFHSEHEGNILLMHSYVQLIAKNATFKVARLYQALKMNDNRAQIEHEILAQMKLTLEEEKLGQAILITQVQVKSMMPSAAVKAAADSLVRAQSDLLAKEVEVQTAKKEAERIAALNSNVGAISYMNAQALMKIAEGIANGKVSTVVVPYDFKGIINVK